MIEYYVIFFISVCVLTITFGYSLLSMMHFLCKKFNRLNNWMHHQKSMKVNLGDLHHGKKIK